MSTTDDITATDQDVQLAVIRRNINVNSYGTIKTIMGSRIVDALPLRLRCECAVVMCEDIIEITLASRRKLRRNYASAFIVTSAHATANEKFVLHRAEKFCVVEMPGFTQTVVDL